MVRTSIKSFNFTTNYKTVYRMAQYDDKNMKAQCYWYNEDQLIEAKIAFKDYLKSTLLNPTFPQETKQDN